MKLIADSGSTKTAWKLISNSGLVKSIYTSGINPFFRNEDDIFEELSLKLLPETGSDVSEIYFYGAGIINVEKGMIISNALSRIYKSAIVNTYSDVLASAHALFGHKSGIACILGTGSNACLYNGKEIVKGISPLGFILGDEGSGAVMGRKLIGDFLKEVMPEDLRIIFSNQFNISREEILNRVYRTEKPNKFLAQFTIFLFENIEKEYCADFVTQNFSEFFARNICKIDDFNSYNLGFCGSVAWYFQEILTKVAKNNGFDNLTIIKDPIDQLEKYYL